MTKRIYSVEVDGIPDHILDVELRAALSVAIAQELRLQGVATGFSVGTSGGKQNEKEK